MYSYVYKRYVPQRVWPTKWNVQDLDQWRADKQQADSILHKLASATMLKAQGAAFAAVDALMLTDAPLLYSPSLLALAALRAGFRKVQPDCSTEVGLQLLSGCLYHL